MWQTILDYLRRVWQAIKDFWQGIERRDRLRFIAISALALTGVIVAIVMLTRTNYAVLYSRMDNAELAEVRDILSAGGVRYRVEGDTILIPDNLVREWQLTLANQGYPSTGVSYEYLENIAGFGTSDYEKRLWENINAREVLRDIIMANPAVHDARVVITNPNNTSGLFASEIIPVKATVSLTLLEPLTPEQVAGVIKIVSSGYPDLAPENVAVSDQWFNPLNPAEPTEFDVFAEQEEIRLQMQARFEHEILKLLVPIFQADRVGASVNLKLDFDERTSESITFGPVVGNEDGIIVSLQRTIEKATGGQQAGQPGADENGWDEPLYAEVGDTSDSWESLIETINYEVNQVVERLSVAKGKITDIYASITIDSNELLDDLDDVRAIQSIVGGVLGLDRGDYGRISVNIMPFQGAEFEREAWKKMADDQAAEEMREFIFRMALLGVLLICLLVIIWRVFKLFHRGPSEEELMEMQRASELEDLDEYTDLLRLASEAEPLEETKTPERLKIEDFVERSPEMVATLLRNWLNDEPVRRR